MPATISAAALIGRYDVILLDAYGVLVTAEGAMPTGRALLAEIARQNRGFFVVTNDASRLPATCADRFRSLGLDIDETAIITSGALLGPYFAEHGLRGASCMVLGPEDSKAYVRAAGGRVVPVRPDGTCEVLIVGDDSGYPFLETIDDALSALYRQFDRDREVALILPNPDLIYPKGTNTYGFTSGAVAMLLEAGLARRYPGRQLTFARLGKPHRPIFDEARLRAGSDSLVMIGDQLETDIAGARAAGIDAALIGTGVTKWDEADGAVLPNYVLI